MQLWGWRRLSAPAPHRTAVLTHRQVFFLECSARCFCFIVLIGVGFYRISLIRWENGASLCSSYTVCGEQASGCPHPLDLSVPDRPGSTQARQG